MRYIRNRPVRYVIVSIAYLFFLHVLYTTSSTFAYMIHEIGPRYAHSLALALQKDYPELKQISSKSTFKELILFFTDLAERKGASYAFEILRRSELSQEIDIHLLGHAIGDVLYRKEGISGMKSCTPDFRNACSHSIVVGAFIERGEAALDDIYTACSVAPGGKAASSLCFHGLGHGVLVYAEYDMEKAAMLCNKINFFVDAVVERAECIGGAVMELTGGGFHDPEMWRAVRSRYLNKEDPLSLCRSVFIADESKYKCFMYITPFLVEALGSDPNKPSMSDIENAFQYCDTVPVSEPLNREMCFGGFAKYILASVFGRLILPETIYMVPDDILYQVHEWCMRAGDPEGSAACIRNAVTALYWDGRNDMADPIRFCAGISNKYQQQACFDHLMLLVGYYRDEEWYYRVFCREIPVLYQSQCKITLHL